MWQEATSQGLLCGCLLAENPDMIQEVLQVLTVGPMHASAKQ